MAKILVVEDMPDSAEMTAQILRRYDHDVLIAENGEQALRLVQEYRPDLILYDYWLPDLDARTFLHRLRAMPGFQHMKVVVCTAAPESVMQKTVTDMLFNGWITKPYRLSALMQVIEEQLS